MSRKLHLYDAYFSDFNLFLLRSGFFTASWQPHSNP